MTSEHPDEYPNVLPEDSRTDVAVSLGTILASAVPGLGGVVASVLSEWSAERRYARIREVIEDLALRLANSQSEASQAYIRSDEFPDLLDQTLRRVAHERHEGKRRLYATFLAGAIENPGEPYDEQLRLLRTIEQLQPDHIRILRAMLQEPAQTGPGGSGTIIQTFERRLPGMSRDRITDLVVQLGRELHLVTLPPELTTPLAARSAENLRGRFTKYGEEVVDYIRTAEPEGR